MTALQFQPTPSDSQFEQLVTRVYAATPSDKKGVIAGENYLIMSGQFVISTNGEYCKKLTPNFSDAAIQALKDTNFKAETAQQLWLKVYQPRVQQFNKLSAKDQSELAEQATRATLEIRSQAEALTRVFQAQLQSLKSSSTAMLAEARQRVSVLEQLSGLQRTEFPATTVVDSAEIQELENRIKFCQAVYQNKSFESEDAVQKPTPWRKRTFVKINDNTLSNCQVYGAAALSIACAAALWSLRTFFGY